jgi:hypothetical protein
MNRYRLGARAHCVTGVADPCSVAAVSRCLPVAHADPLEPKTTAAAPMPGIAQVGADGSSWRPTPDHSRPLNGGWASPHWGANHQYGVWAPHGGPPVPTYWVWDPSGGAFDYPFEDWRRLTGGWGNPWPMAMQKAGRGEMGLPALDLRNRPRSRKPAQMRAGLLRISLRLLTWVCVVLLGFLSLRRPNR